MFIIRFYWLIAPHLFISLVRNASFLIVKLVVSEKKSVMSTNHCSRISCWWVCAFAPHLWCVHLPNWHFSLQPSPLQRLGIFAVDNFQRLVFGSLPTSSQERVKQKSTFRFIFALRTIYKVNVTARYLEICSLATDNDAILTLYLIHTLSLTLRSRAWNSQGHSWLINYCPCASKKWGKFTWSSLDQKLLLTISHNMFFGTAWL